MAWRLPFLEQFFLSLFLVLCVDVDVKNLRIVSGSADNKICVSLISSQVSVLNARGWVEHLLARRRSKPSVASLRKITN